MTIKEGELDLAGWLSIANAIIAIPSVVMSILLESIEGTGARVIQGILILLSLGLFIYVLSSLRKLLNSRFQFHDVDIYISLLIWGNVVLEILNLSSLASRRLEFAVDILSMAAFIFFGILGIMFATRLLRLSGNLFGLLKPFSYTSIVSAVCFVTVLLAPLGIIAGAVADVILGIIFFRAADQPPSAFEVLNTPIE